jgi:hypothetical protein
MKISLNDRSGSGDAIELSDWKTALVALSFCPIGSGLRRDDALPGDLWLVIKDRDGPRVMGIKDAPPELNHSLLFNFDGVRDYIGSDGITVTAARIKEVYKNFTDLLLQIAVDGQLK